MDYDGQLRVVSSVVTALADGAEANRKQSAESILQLLGGLLNQPGFKSSPEGSSKSTFKSLVLKMLQLGTVSAEAEQLVGKLASILFECRPYTFIIALTDALEDDSHPALTAAVAFGKRFFVADLTESGLFLVCASCNSASCNSSITAHAMLGTQGLGACAEGDEE